MASHPPVNKTGLVYIAAMGADQLGLWKKLKYLICRFADTCGVNIPPMAHIKLPVVKQTMYKILE